MKRNSICSAIAALLFLPLALTAQTDGTQTIRPGFAEMLNRVRNENPTLKALRAHLSSTEMANSATVALPDPEAEVTWANGSPKGVPSRTNVSLTQTLDWAVITGRSRAAAKAANNAAAARFRLEEQNVMAEADELLVDAVYANRLCSELSARAATAETLATLYERKYANGDANRLELNKVRLNLAVSRSELQRATAEREVTLEKIARLCGTTEAELTDTLYPQSANSLPALPELQAALPQSAEALAAEAATAESRATAHLLQSRTWPALTVGFQGEYVKGNNYNGVSLGLTLPVWGGTRRELKAAKSNIAATELDAEETRLRLASLLSERYSSAKALATNAEALAENLSQTSNAHLLQRSLDEGHISLMDYLMESSFYYTARSAQLEAERDAQRALSRVRSMFY